LLLPVGHYSCEFRVYTFIASTPDIYFLVCPYHNFSLVTEYDFTPVITNSPC
jgi:hypothetical protein